MVHVSTEDGKEKRGTRRMIIDATAGAIAGCIARVITGPLDVIKIRFQIQLEPIMGAPPQSGRRSKYTGFGQAFTTIVREEGLQGLWRGTVPGLLLTVPYTAVQFVALHQVRQAAAAYGFTANPGSAPLISLTSGALAGAAATVASYPFDLLRTTLAAQGEPRVYRNMWDAARVIVSQRGPAGLYSGLGVTLVEIMPYAALQFGLYDALNALADEARIHYQRDVADAAAAVAAAAASTATAAAATRDSVDDHDGGNDVRHQRSPRHRGGGKHGTSQRPSQSQSQGQSQHGDDDGKLQDQCTVAIHSPGKSASTGGRSSSSGPSLSGVQSSRLQAFACGLLAGLLAKLATHPLDVAKKRYQVAGLQRSLSYGARVEAGFAMRSLGQSLAYIYRTEGLMGLWKGSVPSIVKAAPSAAITFAAYDAVLAWLLVMSGEQQPASR